jgi:hypothetical protein
LSPCALLAVCLVPGLDSSREGRLAWSTRPCERPCGLVRDLPRLAMAQGVLRWRKVSCGAVPSVGSDYGKTNLPARSDELVARTQGAGAKHWERPQSGPKRPPCHWDAVQRLLKAARYAPSPWNRKHRRRLHCQRGRACINIKQAGSCAGPAARPCARRKVLPVLRSCVWRNNLEERRGAGTSISGYC